MASTATVVRTLEQAIINIDMLYDMPMAEWELQTRVKANVDHATSVFNEWLKEKGEGPNGQSVQNRLG